MMRSVVAVRSGALRSLTYPTRIELWCTSICAYSRSSVCLEESVATATEEPDPKAEAFARKIAARDFNNRRAAYRRKVGALRREFAEEVARQRAADKAAQEALQRALTRRRLERQHKKNIRTATNAMRDKQRREQREKEFNEYLDDMQRKRDAKQERYAAARQMVIDELEAEAHLWLTTHEEVEAAFTRDAEQKLWARRGGVLGALNPSLDSHFWQYEPHPWRMEKVYKSQRDYLVEELQNLAYEEANVDKRYWTPERIKEQDALEAKARLREMVYYAGQVSLLTKQQRLVDEHKVLEDGEIPKRLPVPSHTLLTDHDAVEREGVRLLLQDPTKFFEFEDSQPVPNLTDDPSSVFGSETGPIYWGPSLGRPIALRDFLRDGRGSVFPRVIGKHPPPDTRTEREKKQQAKEDKLSYDAMIAQLEQRSSLDGDSMIEMEDLIPDIDYDKVDVYADFAEWDKGLDPEKDKELLELPYERKYSEEDVDFAMEKLRGQLAHFQAEFDQRVEGLKVTAQNQVNRAKEEMAAAGVVEEDDAESLDDVILSLSQSELVALAELSDRFTEDTTEDEFNEMLKDIPSMTADQVKLILEKIRDE